MREIQNKVSFQEGKGFSKLVAKQRKARTPCFIGVHSREFIEINYMKVTTKMLLEAFAKF